MQPDAMGIVASALGGQQLLQACRRHAPDLPDPEAVILEDRLLIEGNHLIVSDCPQALVDVRLSHGPFDEGRVHLHDVWVSQIMDLVQGIQEGCGLHLRAGCAASKQAGQKRRPNAPT
jgi:hypothetical protein